MALEATSARTSTPSLTASVAASGSPTMMTTLLSGVTTRRLASIWAIRRRLANWRFASHGAIPRTDLLSVRIWLRRMHSTGRPSSTG